MASARIRAALRRLSRGSSDVPAVPDVAVTPDVAEEPPFKRTLRRVLGEDLAEVPAPRVAVVSDRSKSRVGRWLAQLAPDASVVRLGPEVLDEDRRLQRELAIGGRFHLIVDETESGPRFARIPGLFFHLERGGVLLLRNPRRGAVPRSDEARTDAAALGELTGAAARAAGRPDGGRPRRRRGMRRRDVLGVDDLERFGASVRRLALTDTGVELSSGVDAWVKVREEDANELLARRGIGSVLATLPPTRFEARGTLRQSASDHAGPIARSWRVPELSVREYADVISWPGQVLSRDGLLLPDTFRHNQHLRLGNRFLAELARDFAQPALPDFADEAPGGQMRRLEGAYLHLDSEFRGHFGHLTTEVLARLWAWDRVEAAYPGIKVLVHVNRRPELLDYELEILEAAGVPRDRVVFARDAVVVDRLIAATPMFSNPAYVHPDIADLWRRTGDRLASAAPPGESPERIFVSRRIEKRVARNAPDIEKLFDELGFTVLYPEDYPLSEQVRLFREARVVAGFAGSGMFNLMFAEPKDVILVSAESYWAQNEYLISAARGHRVHVAWCRSEAELAPSGEGYPHTEQSLQSPFVFDFEREGEFVRSVAADLR